MALYLLGKTGFHSSEDFLINGHSIYDQYGQLTQILQKHCPSIYLAEPTITDNKDPESSFISWYADTKTEPTIPLDNQQSLIDQKLADAVTSLSQAYPAGSAESTLLNAALHVQNKQDILIADDKIVLKGWGVNASSGNDASGLSLFPLSPATPETSNDQNSDPASNLAHPSATNTIIPPTTGNIMDASKRSTGAMGGMPVFLTRVVAAILFFIIGLLLGWRILYAERPTKIAKVPVMEAQDLVRKKPEIDQKNKALEDEIKKLEDLLKNPPCDLGKNRGAPELNKSLDNSSAPMKSDGKNFQGSLPDLLEKSTVFILVKTKDDNGDDAIAAGSGFFVTPDTIVTNRHVVEGSDGTVLVTNKTLGQFKKAHVVSISSPSSDVNSFDLAVLKIEDAPPQQPLSFSLEAQPLQTVVAAGYPAIIIRQDGALKRLAQGDVNAIPGVILTKGEINAIQENSKGEKIMPHSAAVSPGNSGGELVDLCGRVVGVNTFVTMDSETSSHSNYAQKSDSIVQALQGANLPIQVQSGACKDGVPTGNVQEDKQQPAAAPTTTPTKDDKTQGSQSTPDQKVDATKPKENTKQPVTTDQKTEQSSTSQGDKP